MPDQRRSTTSPFDYYRRLSRVRRYVESNLDEQILLADAARVANLSPGYFSTFFHDKTGLRFHDWLTQLRVQRAKQRISERNLSITELAYWSGFGDLRTFERAFKRWTGQTPRSFKRQCRPETRGRPD